MKLAHVSDLHILPPDSEAPGGGPTSREVARAIAGDLAAIAGGLDLVVVSGDLTDKADAASFAAFEEIFSAVGLPVVVVPGNHDGPAGMMDYLGGATALSGWDISNRVVEVGDVRLLGLNTSVEALTQGALDDTALAAVEREIRRESDRQLVIVMHHPPLLLGLAQFDSFCAIERLPEFMGLLEGAREPTLVLSGHVHRPYTARQGGISCFVAGSMTAPYDSALPFGRDPIRPTTPQDFYFVHDIGPGGRHVVTPQRVRGLARPGGAGPETGT